MPAMRVSMARCAGGIDAVDRLLVFSIRSAFSMRSMSDRPQQPQPPSMVVDPLPSRDRVIREPSWEPGTIVEDRLEPWDGTPHPPPRWPGNVEGPEEMPFRGVITI